MKICWFGIYNPEEGRNRIYIKGLKENGVEILECRDNSGGFLKFWSLFKKHQKIRNSYDAMVAGYPGHIVVPLAKIISRKPVIFDALCSMYEGVIISRKEFYSVSPKPLYIKIIDFLAVKFADIVLLETEAQRKYFEERFGKNDKYKVLYTGADDSVFYQDQNIKKREKFTAIFRGKFLPEAGVRHILEAAKILEDQGVSVVIMGSGWLEKEIKIQIASLKLKNLEFISGWVSSEHIRKKMSECHVSLGQFEDHERLKRTIPHKCFESLALGLPYITAHSAPVSEILKDGESVLFVKPADPKDIADKVLELKNNSGLVEKLGRNGLKIYTERFAPKPLAKNLLDIVQSAIHEKA